LAINEAVQGKKYSTLQPVNEKVKKVVHLLGQLDHFIDVSASIVLLFTFLASQNKT